MRGELGVGDNATIQSINQSGRKGEWQASRPVWAAQVSMSATDYHATCVGLARLSIALSGPCSIN